MMYYTYVLISKKDGKFYTGTTGNLKGRFEKHNKGIVPSTKHRKPFHLVYYEACPCADDAFRRERYLKTGKDKRCLRNRLKRSLESLRPRSERLPIRSRLKQERVKLERDPS